MVFQDGDSLEGFFENGVLNGFSRRFDAKGNLKRFGYFDHGKPVGIWWSLIVDGGTVVGPVDERGNLTGTEIVFLYPDFKTGLMGNFQDGQLVCAQAVTLICTVEEHKMPIPLFSEPTGAFFKREISTLEVMTSHPRLPDPYESEMVVVKPSSVPGANEGLFARKNISPGTVLAFYNGIRRLPKQNFDKPDWVKSAYRIFDPTRKKGERGSLDIPKEYIALNNYCATLAHKTNHSFLPSAEFEEYEHPCYGLVPCLRSITDIGEGEEIFVHYCYSLEHCPDWFLQAWEDGNYPVPESFKDWQDQVKA